MIGIHAVALACSSDREHAALDRTASGGSQIVISQAADTAIVRSAGVPTDPDDTIGTRYQKHEAPRRISPPACLPAGIALCIADTARTLHSGDVEADGGTPDGRQTDWLVFAASRDSMQLFMVPSQDSYLVMAPRSAAGFSGESAAGVDASWIRARFPGGGTYVFTASLSSDTIITYELRVAPTIATGASRPIGASATLTLASDSSTRVAIVPSSMARSLRAAGFESFAVRPGSYRVLLVRDTSYVACRLPCVNPRTFAMRPRQAVTIAP